MAEACRFVSCRNDSALERVINSAHSMGLVAAAKAVTVASIIADNERLASVNTRVGEAVQRCYGRSNETRPRGKVPGASLTQVAAVWYGVGPIILRVRHGASGSPRQPRL